MKVFFHLTFCFVLAVLLSTAVDGLIGHRFWKIKEQVYRNRLERKQQLLQAKNDPNPVETFYLKQPLDHFSAVSRQSGKTYMQRYYVNKKYWQPATYPGPVFLFIGGEGTLSSHDIAVGEIVDLADQHDALLVAAEHRFYGDSLNDDGLQLEELQHLSSQQALADLETLIQHIRKTYNLDNETPWICFGGSYPGALSAWFRLKYPHLVNGAVASSAPVRAILNFEGYNEVVADSLSNSLVGGSPECLFSVSKAFKTIDQMILSGEFGQLAEDFKSCGPISEKMDTVTFVSNLAGVFMGVVQYNLEMGNINISSVCKTMLNSSDSYKNLVAINEEMVKTEPRKCIDNSYMNYTLLMMNTTVDRKAFGPGIRQWTFQTCSQFGYYQTCDEDTKCPFSHLMSLNDSDLSICQKVFNIYPNQVIDNIQFTNDYYGSNKTRQSRIIFVNGSIDPWHALSILKNQTAFGEFGVFIPGTAHCADLEPARSSDSYALLMAREQIASLVGQFVFDPMAKVDKPPKL